jgi:hypothetical protein
VRLFQRPDFDQAVLRAAEHFQIRSLRPAIIERDYYVTEALRIIAATAGDRAIFKGGTSLAKGWNLIQRFSEDIDLFLDPLAFDPTLGKKAIDRELKKLRDAVGAHPALTFLAKESHTIGGFGRSDRFSYGQRFGGPGEVPDRVLVQAGTASGREPTTVVELRSYIADFMAEKGATLGANDEGSFPMRLLHFRRTFVEKMFAIHSKAELFKRNRQPIGSYARHHYDLLQLAVQPEVTAMLRSDEYATKGRLRPGQPHALREALLLSHRNELFQQRRVAPARGTRRNNCRRVRKPVSNALLWSISFLGGRAEPFVGNTGVALADASLN